MQTCSRNVADLKIFDEKGICSLERGYGGGGYTIATRRAKFLGKVESIQK